MHKQKKLSARILSLALSAAMVTTMLPMTVFAAEGDAPLGASAVGTIQSFDKLGDRFIPAVGKDAPDHVYGLSVEPNTPVEDLNLPDELTAMVARTTTVSAPAEDEPVVDSGKPSEPAEDETIPDEDTVVDGDTATDETVSDNQPATPSDAEEEAKEEIKDEDVPLAPEPEQNEETLATTVEQETIPVTWQSDKEYQPGENGTFTYTAVLPEDYILADGVELPQIYVAAGKQARAGGLTHDISSDSLAIADNDGCTEAAPHVVNGTTTTNTITVGKGTHFVTLDGVSIVLANGTPLTINSDPSFSTTTTVNLTLAEGKSNTLTASEFERQAVSVDTRTELVIDGTGSLTANGGTVGSGIAVNADDGETSGSLIINGGTIVANGGMQAAGIGSSSMGQQSGKVTINGGTVTATGGAYAYGIGGGSNGKSDTICINGGTVTAIGTVGIGGSDGGTFRPSADIKISNAATVTAVSSTADNAIRDTDDAITSDSGTIANILSFKFAEKQPIGTTIVVKDSSGESLSPSVSYTSAAEFQSIAFSVPTTGTYTAYQGTKKLTFMSEGTSTDTFNVVAGLNTFSGVVPAALPDLTTIIVGGTDATEGYETADVANLNKAVAAIAEGGTIKLGADISADGGGVVIGNKVCTFDLNGKTLATTNDSSMTPVVLLNGTASLTVTDSSGGKNGKITSNAGTYTIRHDSTGNLTISAGTVSHSSDNSAIACSNSNGTITIEGGIVSSNSMYFSTIESNGKITMSGGTVTGVCAAATNGTIKITAVPTPAAIVLDIRGGTVSNTGSSSYDWAVYNSVVFPNTVTAENRSSYYSHTGGTVGTVVPAVLADYTGIQAAAPSSTPSAKTATSITLAAVTVSGETIEYAKSTTSTAPTTGWQDSTAFAGLTADTQYYFFARVKANTTHKAGITSAATAIKTDMTDAQKVAAAKRLADTAITNLTATNATTAVGILSTVDTAIASVTGVTATWKADPTITAATDSAPGSIAGTIVLTCGAATVEVTVSKVIAQLGSDDGGDDDGGSSTPPSTKPTEPVTGSSSTNATVDGNGNATANVTDKNITDAVQAAKDAANKKGVNAGEITAVINVTSPANSNPNTVTVNLPKTVQQQVINNKIDNVAIVIDKPDISIGMNLATITEMNKQANADIALSATRTDATALSAEAKNAIGNRPAFDLKATYASGTKSITNFGTGSVRVAIPYTLQAGEVAGGLYAVYVDGNGKVNDITNSSYDADAKVLRFSTNHFSVYGISYKAPIAFTDIASHWAKTDIEFVVNRGLMSGTSHTTFAPNSAMTRGMFVTALASLSGVDASSYKTEKFTDVKADAYYAPYVNWAATKGIVTGTSDTTFAPDQSITRQEMAVIMSSYAKSMGYTIPETHTAVTFADNGSVGSWAAAAVKQMQMAGILNGKDGNRFDPTGTATRGEISAMLHRYVALVIDAATEG